MICLKGIKKCNAGCRFVSGITNIDMIGVLHQPKNLKQVWVLEKMQDTKIYLLVRMPKTLTLQNKLNIIFNNGFDDRSG